MISPIYALITLLAASTVIAAPVAHPEPNAAAATISQVMPQGAKSPPPVPVGSDNAPFVTYLDPWNNWHTQRVNDPTALLNGNYIVTAINNINICSGNWAFLYKVTAASNYPQCNGNFGQYNTGDPTNGPRPFYNGLKYGTCPSPVFRWSKTYNKWINAAYTNCWTGYWNWGQSNDGTSGTSTFPNGMKVGYCCFN